VTEAEDEGVTIEFLSSDSLQGGFEEKLDLVLEKVRDRTVLVLDEAWTPQEKKRLIEGSMEAVDDDFPGVEFMGFSSDESKVRRVKSLVYQKFLNEDYRPGITIVGNSRVMDKIREVRNAVSFIAKMEEN